MSGIAKELTKRGMMTKKGKEFTVPSIQTILENEEFYRGIYQYGSTRKVGTHEPILL